MLVIPCTSLKFTLVNAIKSYVFLPMDKYQSGHAMKKTSPGGNVIKLRKTHSGHPNNAGTRQKGVPRGDAFLSSPRLQVAPKRAP